MSLPFARAREVQWGLWHHLCVSKTNSHSLLLWAKEKAVFPWSMVTSQGKKYLYPRLPFTKSHTKIKLIPPLPPAFSSLLPRESLHATSSYASLTNALHQIFGFFHIWVGRFSPPVVFPSTGNTLKPSQGRKLAQHASPCSSQEEMYVLLTVAQLSFSFLLSSPFKELIEVDSEVVFELAAYILQVSTHLLSLGASSCCIKSFDFPNPQWLYGSVGVPPSCRKRMSLHSFHCFCQNGYRRLSN